MNLEWSNIKYIFLKLAYENFNDIQIYYKMQF